MSKPGPAMGDDHSHDPRELEPEEIAHTLVELAIQLVESGLALLPQLSDEKLQQSSQLIPGGTVGKHLRHVTETFDAFLQPLMRDAYQSLTVTEPLVIDYDAPLPQARHGVARSLDTCIRSMTTVRDGLVALGQHAELVHELDREVQVISLTPSRVEVTSTMGRELWFLCLHTIHHYTMIRTIACNELGVSLPVEFGMAPVTVMYRDRLKLKDARDRKLKAKL